MIELGKKQKLEVIKNNMSGIFLNSKVDRDEEDILLPKKSVPQEIGIGDEIEVFVYKDSENRLVATTKTPKLVIGELATLKVVEVTNIGAFMDWGLEKDLFLPFKEQKEKVKKDGTYLVGLYVDNSDRLCATMDIYTLLSFKSPYKETDRVKGILYSISKEYGAFVAIDNKYHGCIPNKELYGDYKLGDNVEVRIKRIRLDGMLELSLRKEAYIEINTDASKILDRLKAKGGSLPLNDNSNPEAIKAEFNMSKAAFKRAVGRLFREKKIEITEKGIKLV